MCKYICPRCGNANIVNFKDSFVCSECRLEFSKEDFNRIEDRSNILAIEEKLGITQVLEKYSKGDLLKQLNTQDTLKKI